MTVANHKQKIEALCHSPSSSKNRSQKPRPLDIVTTPIKHDQCDRLSGREDVYPCMSVIFFGAIPQRYPERSAKGL